MKYFVVTGAVLLITVFVISPAYASFTDSILVQISGEFKKVYYNEKNVISVLFDPDSASIIFETGSNATLEIKAPKVYKEGPGLFILKSGEEVAPETETSDDCFYYFTIETKTPQTIEVAFTYWPEYPETVENCETFGPVAPLTQTALGIPYNEIQCKQNLVLVQKYDRAPACVTEPTKQKLVERGWINPRIIQELIQRLEYNPHGSLEVSSRDAKFIEQLALQDSAVANFVSEIEWEPECCKDIFMVETQEYEISITFQRLDKDNHLRVVFDRDTLEIMDITNDRYIRHTPIPQDSLDIARIEDNHVHLNPTGMCATITLELMSPDELNQKTSEKEIVFFEIDDKDLNEMSVLRELIRATHYIEPPRNTHEQIELSLRELVDYELFIMNKSIAKYGDTKEDYFLNLDSDLDEKLANSQKQGFANEFNSPILVYDGKSYSVDGTVFWTSNEHEQRRIGVYLQDEILQDEKFITLTEHDMKLLPKIKNAIDSIGTKFEDVVAFKGVPENPDWNQYREWFQQKSKQFDPDKQYVMGFVYDDEYYDLGFPIC